MTWRPPIKDPVSIEADDDRERCEQCGKDKNDCHCEEDLNDIF
jgi:hypothetical protein